jgi:hypothetical protein
LPRAKAADAAVEAATQQAASADAQYQLTLQAALMQDIPARTTSWRTSTADDYRPAWYFNKAEQIDAAQAGITSAERPSRQRWAIWKRNKRTPAARTSWPLKNDWRKLKTPSVWRTPPSIRWKFSTTRTLEDAAEEVKETAQAEFDSALAEYERLLTDSAADAVIQARLARGGRPDQPG